MKHGRPIPSGWRGRLTGSEWLHHAVAALSRRRIISLTGALNNGMALMTELAGIGTTGAAPWK